MEQESLTTCFLSDKVNKLDFEPTVHLYLPVDKKNRDYFRRINHILPGAAWQLSVCLVALRFAKLFFCFIEIWRIMKALVLFSGGLDSSVCLGMAVSRYGADEVLALSIYYGQKHKKEMEASEKIAAYYGVKRITLDLGEIFRDSTCTLLEGAEGDIPHEEYAEQLSKTENAPVSTYVPFRNGLFLSSAAAIALSHGCEVIYYGAHADDAAGNAYPDTSEAFNKAISDAVYIGSGNALRVIAPFIDQSKAGIVAEGTRIGVPFELTWSCYEGHDKACGVCGTCRDRKRAFAENGLKDPIEYEE